MCNLFQFLTFLNSLLMTARDLLDSWNDSTCLNYFHVISPSVSMRHRLLAFILPCWRDGWKGGPKGASSVKPTAIVFIANSIKTSSSSFFCYCEMTTTVLLLLPIAIASFLSLGSILWFLSWEKATKQKYFLFWCQ